MRPLNANVLVCRSDRDAAFEAAEMFAHAAARSVAARGEFNAAIPGGQSPRMLYAALAQHSDELGVPWEHTRIFFTDERCVPSDHEDSNYKLARDLLLSQVPIRRKNIYRFPTEFTPQEAARRYEQSLRGALGDTPRLDLVILGMGADMHTASLFPGSAAVAEQSRLVVETCSKTRGWRLTMTPPLLNSADIIVVMAFGQAKAQAVAAALTLPADPELRPVQVIRPVDGRLVWIIDSEAASEL